MRTDRRRFAGGLLAASAFPLFPFSEAAARVAPTKSAAAPNRKAFSKFVDIAEEAGLRTPMVYGGVDADKYIIESMGGGCAIFDYDNDGWMDIFIIGGRRLENTPPGASNRLYKNNRD